MHADHRRATAIPEFVCFGVDLSIIIDLLSIVLSSGSTLEPLRRDHRCSAVVGVNPPRLVWSQVAIACDVWRESLVRESLQEKNNLSSRRWWGKVSNLNCGAALDHATTATVLRYVEE